MSSHLAELQPDTEEHPFIATQNLKNKHDFYFACYTDLEIHETMLKDTVRTLAYKNAIQNNKHLFQGKTVLDIGAGTLILSLFAAEHAKKVYAVEHSGITRFAEKIKVANKMSNIEVIEGKMENVELPEEVDIIISEWMGYGLFFEDMVNCVIGAAHKWLRPTGYIFPQISRLFLATASNNQLYKQTITFWDNVYGYDMSPCKNELLSQIYTKDCSTSTIIDQTLIFQMDILKTQPFDDGQYLNSKFDLREKEGENAVDHLILWFDVEFPGGHILTTHPKSPITHWKQCVIFLRPDIKTQGSFKGEVSIRKHPTYSRKLALYLMYETESGEHHQDTYFLV